MIFKRISLLFFFCFVVSMLGFQEIKKRDVKTYSLKGIAGMGVVVESLPNWAIEHGLTVERLTTATELRLRREPIKVLVEEDFFEMNQPYLYVNVNWTGGSYNIDLKVQEWVTLKRDTSISCYASNWGTSLTGITQNPEKIISGLNRLLDMFLNDYYKENPKSAR